MLKISIGIDSLDSQYGGCTTHVLYRVFKRLAEKGYVESVLDYPYLVRLNPSIPHKTRGNGAVAVSLELSDGKSLNHIVDEITKTIIEYVYHVNGDVSRACVAVVPYDLNEYFREIYLKALTDFVHLDYVRRIINPVRESVIFPLGLNKGCIGALAALGWDKSKCSYELLIYRHPSHTGTSRRMIDTNSLAEIDMVQQYETFCTYDYEKNRTISVPQGPDPVLVGVRGLDPDKLVKILVVLKLVESIEGWMIFKTNQGTGAHMIPRPTHESKPFRTACLAGLVKDVFIRPGGDVLLNLFDGFGILEVAVFKETGLTKYARLLVTGDVVRACGSVKLWNDSRPVLHAELVEIIELEEKYFKRNPRCPNCGARMKSAGRGQGYRCLKCGFRALDVLPEILKQPREISAGTYLPKCGSVKHLGIPASLSNLSLECFERTPRFVSDFY